MNDDNKSEIGCFVMGILMGSLIGALIVTWLTEGDRIQSLWADKEQKIIRYESKYYKLVELEQDWKEKK